jgi:hypothetical protein
MDRPESPATMRGKDLMESGLLVGISDAPQAALIIYKKKQ